MNIAAQVNKVSGTAFVVRGGSEISLTQGMKLLVSDAVRTGLDSGCELHFADGTQVQLGPLTQVSIEDFAYDPAGSVTPSFAMHMMEGLVNTVSGEVVKLNPEGFSLSTPLGTAGIRGTTILARIFPTHVVIMVTDMVEGHSVHINNIFGNSLTIFQPGQGVELSLDGHNELRSFDFLPQDLKDLLLNFMEDSTSGSESHPFFLYGDTDFLAAVGATALGDNVGMLAAQDEEILIALLDELGVEQPEFFLEGPPEGPKYPKAGSIVNLDGDDGDNLLVPGEAVYGPEFKDVYYAINGAKGNDTIVVHNGQDTVYGGQGSYDQIFKISDAMTDGVMLYGGADFLKDEALDNDVIVIRALGTSEDTEAGWTSTDTTEYGATVMDGGMIYGSAREVDNTTGGATAITLYGAMNGGIIYGNAETASNSSFDKSVITVSGAMGGGAIYGDAGTLTNSSGGGDVIDLGVVSNALVYGDAGSMASSTGGDDTIYIDSLNANASVYGDAGTINGGRTGNDSFDIGEVAGGNIYGDGETYLDPNNIIYGNNIFTIGAMSAGSIDAGNGNDKITISGDWSDGSINLGNGTDILKVDGSTGNVNLSAGAGSAEVDLATLAGTLSASVLANGSISFTFKAFGNESSLALSGEGNYKINAMPDGSDLDLGDGDLSLELVNGLKNGGTLGLGSAGQKILGLGDSASPAAVVIDDGALIDGTANHDGQQITLTGSMGDGSVSLGNGIDIMSITGSMGGGSVNLGDGADQLTISGGMSGGTLSLGSAGQKILGLGDSSAPT
ncbi:FecR domain-containing protein, partial [Desulfovibrio sp. OttesenSCG-928-M14]|nr:FecR domain-containing protein [Desulfovibrio sp. OttesenSCG-928-M14]